MMLVANVAGAIIEPAAAGGNKHILIIKLIELGPTEHCDLCRILLSVQFF